MSQAQTQATRYHVEALPHATSQIHPIPTVTNSTVSNPGITAFSMAVHWEHLLSRERDRSRNLECWVSSLETEVRKKEADFSALKADYERLCVMVQRHSCAIKSVQPSPTGSSYDAEAKALSPSVFLPPPSSLFFEASKPLKRKFESVDRPCKRQAARGLALSIERPVSPKSLFSPTTPVTMQTRKDE